MEMARVFDLIAMIVLLIVLVLPKASLSAKPALETLGPKTPQGLDPTDLDRLAALEDQHFALPENVDRSVDLAEMDLRLLRPAWALSTLAEYDDRGDYRVFLLETTAHAERLEPADTVAAAKRGLDACDHDPKCTDGARVKINLIAASMQVLIDRHIDPQKDPQKAKEAVASVLHAATAKGKAALPQ